LARIYENINFCICCGTKLVLEDKFGGIRPTCPKCGWIFFPDPKVAAAGLICDGGNVLLARRRHDPQRGLWTLPAGFVDAGEDPRETVRRECLEETGLNVRIVSLFDVIPGLEHPRGAHILIVYRAEIVSGELAASDDADQVGFFPLDNLPPLAFSTTTQILSKL
jgi:8-oxo-dGTP diphosphatase